MLRLRIITAVALLVSFFAALLLLSSALFALILAFCAAFGAREWGRMSGLAGTVAQTIYAMSSGLSVLLVLFLPLGDGVIGSLILLGFLFWLSVVALLTLAPKLPKIQEPDALLLGIGLLILCLAALAIHYLRSDALEASSTLVLYAFSVVWCMDIGAYFSGRRFGRIPLAPSISPGKTREGVYGGLAATMLLMLLVMPVADFAEGKGLKMLLATGLSALASVVGDLYESRLKRAAGVKDSGQLLPGHGGVLDRLDGVLAALPVFAFTWIWL